MPRPRTPINAYGRLAVQQVEPGRLRARARYRFENGTLKQVERFGSTKAPAEWSLKSALTTLTASAAVEVRREMRLADLANRFLQSKADRALRTIDTYRQTIEHLIKPNIGQLAISEATTERLQRFISRLQVENGQGAAKSARAVRSGRQHPRTPEHVEGVVGGEGSAAVPERLRAQLPEDSRHRP